MTIISGMASCNRCHRMRREFVEAITGKPQVAYCCVSRRSSGTTTHAQASADWWFWLLPTVQIALSCSRAMATSSGDNRSPGGRIPAGSKHPAGDVRAARGYGAGALAATHNREGHSCLICGLMRSSTFRPRWRP